MAGKGAQHKESCDLVYFRCVPNPRSPPLLGVGVAVLGTLLFEVFVAFHREGIRAMLMNRCVDGSLSCLAWPA